MIETSLQGCRSTPLANYLKALGIFRLVAEQCDAAVTASWVDGTFAIRGISRDAIEEFFLETYSPTPIMAPWNGGSGFHPSDRQTGIAAIRAAVHPRFAQYKDCLAIATELFEQGGESFDKETLIVRLRAELPDDAIQWIDSVLLLTSQGLKFPPLLGTGGNDGRLEFTNNFMQRIVEVIDPLSGAVAPDRAAWLRSSLFSEPSPMLSRTAFGQFLPASFGGANATVGFEGAQPGNPWDYILMIEGAIFFSAAATRTATTEAGDMSYPFTVRASGSGSGGLASNEPSFSRGEMWLPLWHRPATYAELSDLFSEGRLTVGRRTARDGMEVALAIARLGVDRGIESFERVVFSQRNGLMYIATQQGRWSVEAQHRVSLIADLERDDWLPRVRRFARGDDAPAAIRAAVARLEEAILDACKRPNKCPMQDVLCAVADIHRIGFRSRRFREAIQPLRLIRSRGEDGDWFDAVDDGSIEVTLARSICSLGRGEDSIRFDLLPLSPTRGERNDWAARMETDTARRNLDETLAMNLLNRVREVGKGASLQILSGSFGVALSSWTAFLEGSFDEVRLRELLGGLALIRPEAGRERIRSEVADFTVTPAALKTLFLEGSQSPSHVAVDSRFGSGHPEESREAEKAGLRKRLLEICETLMVGDVDAAVRIAAGWINRTNRRESRLPQRTPSSLSSEVTNRNRGHHLAAAMLLPVNRSAAHQIRSWIFSKEGESNVDSCAGQPERRATTSD